MERTGNVIEKGKEEERAKTGRVKREKIYFSLLSM